MPNITWYRGDCHVHSVHSNGGELTPAQAVAAARAARLDFVAGTEHNTAQAHDLWRGLDAEDLLVLLGQEVVTRDGHWLALGLAPGQLVAWDYDAGEGVLARQLAEVHRVGGLCVAAHPYAPYPTGTLRHPYQGFDVVEVWNGPWTSDVAWQADNEAALADWARALAADVPEGRWRPVIGNSDTHLHGQIAVPHTVVAADRLSADALLAGLRAGRSWIAESAAVHVTFSVSAGPRHAGIGERLTTGGEVVVARVEVRGVPSGVVTFHNQDGPMHSGSPQWQTSAAESAFVRIEVRHPEGHMAALANPIFLS
ncbi:hypothetical protein ABH926_002199 [Catenulispora sp. GP43]|uniref:CehA/McbA family metallohydrolase n=1 Tax=Catenulispora sp. GP43 TaxID=3156263 RepID=UPI003514E3EB